MHIEITLKGLELPHGFTSVTFKKGKPTEEGRDLSREIVERVMKASGVAPTHSEHSASASCSSSYKVVPDLENVPEGTWIVRDAETVCQMSLDPVATESDFTIEDIVAMYNESAKRNKWQQCKAINVTIKRALIPAIKKFPMREDWEAVFIGWEKHHFFSGATGQYTRIKIRTMLHKCRYEEFHEDGTALRDQSTETDSFFADLNAALEKQRV